MWIESGMLLINMDKVSEIYISDEIDSQDGSKYWHIMTDTGSYVYSNRNKNTT